MVKTGEKRRKRREKAKEVEERKNNADK